jgi:hypothetical protein
VKLGGYWYYLDSTNEGLMATGTNVDTIPETQNSNFDSNGRWLGYVK